MGQKSTKEKIKYALRLDRAVAFVWQAGPVMALLNLVFLLIQGVLPIVSLYLMKLIVDNVSAAVAAHDIHASLKPVVVPIFMAGGVALLTELVQLGLGLVKDIQSLSVTDHVYQLLHKKSVSVDLAYYENPEYFDTLHRAQLEGPYRPTRIVNGLTSLVQNGISLAAISILLVSFHWVLAAALFLSVLPGVFVRVVYSGKMFAWQKARTRSEREADYFGWIMTGDIHAKEVRVFGLGGFFMERFNRVRELLRKEKIALIFQRGMGDFFAQGLAVFAIFGALAFIALRCVDGEITIGSLVMYFQAFQKGFGFLKESLQGIAGLYEDNLFIANFYEFLDIVPELSSPAEPLPIVRPFTRQLSFENVSFSYPHCGRKALTDISFTVKPGEIVAVVGENGSGKTTLIKLLCRLYDPAKGRILLDGHDIREFAVQDLREQISVVFQDYMKYQFSVKENIGMGYVARPLSEERVKGAAAFADADGMISKLPDGYDTMLGKWLVDGEELSAGQWQKIALARAFYGKSQIIVLDEPTSALDPRSEYQVFQTFRQLLEKRTAFLISHRFSTVKMADRIIVLTEGRIMESGTHDELMALGGTYFGMYNQQAWNYQT